MDTQDPLLHLRRDLVCISPAQRVQIPGVLLGTRLTVATWSAERTGVVKYLVC